ncbi:MAG TPA: hypothetical protein VFX28_22425, partial [Methylomirabilota bacterium]|nr:hypothetical protein [Methylomirabilota bacterium]
MRADPDLPSSLLEAVRRQSLAPATAAAAAAAQALAEAAEGEVDAVVFFGSRRTGARPEPGSAWDFFVVARDEGRLYRALRSRRLVGRSPRLLAALGRVMPPTSVSLTLPGADGPVLAKCAVSSRGAFARDT